MNMSVNRVELRGNKSTASQMKHQATQYVSHLGHELIEFIMDSKQVRSVTDAERVVRKHCMRAEIIYLSLVMTWTLFMITVTNPLSVPLLSAVLSIGVSVALTPSATGLMAYVYDILVALIEWNTAQLIQRSKQLMLILLPLVALSWLNSLVMMI